MDDRDRAILERLMTDGRTSWSDLSAEVGLSPPSVADRVRKLEEQGVIQGYAARVDPRSLHADTLAFVAVRATGRQAYEHIAAWVERTPEVQECHVVSGEYDYLMKLRCRSTAELGRFLREELRALDGVEGTISTITLATLKETLAIPLTDGTSAAE